jgi:hypothetical protein
LLEILALPFLAAKTFWGIYLALEEREEDIENFTATVSIWLRQDGERTVMRTVRTVKL